MRTVDLARWQFGITTVYHFLFVPLTIGLAFFVAILQTLAHRTGNDVYRRMTAFWGKLFLINFALGVVTGIVQEFQFGMNWSDYSRFVGDIFGAPLAVEGLLAFFLESTFLGLWIFGRDRLPDRLHLLSIWMVAIGTTTSAYFILAANSWMQHPVGYTVNPVTGRAEMHDFLAVLTNITALAAFPHTIFGSWLGAGMLVLGVSAWHLLRGNEVDLFRRSARIALVLAFPAAVGAALTGHFQAQIMSKQQPMKMAAAEALWKTEKPAAFSLFAVGDIRNGRNRFNLAIPRALSYLSTDSLDGEVKGVNDLQSQYEKTYGPGNYRPHVGLAYWSFRVMIGAGLLCIPLTGFGLLLLRRRRLEESRRFLKVILVVGMALPLLSNVAGWVFTEMARQPWVVFGLLRVEDAVSPSVSAAWVATTLAGFTLLYGVLAVVEGWLMLRYAKAGPAPEPEPGSYVESQLAPILAY
ncbi:MAG TPA: cytochrome ubiquinol oxidase subunit I [Acidimicrobiales bacterium]|nr:cytochrome ubiquinol oxidase subunit I [Acidimicrobiales bacterium]